MLASTHAYPDRGQTSGDLITSGASVNVLGDRATPVNGHTMLNTGSRGFLQPPRTDKHIHQAPGGTQLLAIDLLAKHDSRILMTVKAQFEPGFPRTRRRTTNPSGEIAKSQNETTTLPKQNSTARRFVLLGPADRSNRTFASRNNAHCMRWQS